VGIFLLHGQGFGVTCAVLSLCSVVSAFGLGPLLPLTGGGVGPVRPF